MDGRSDRRPTGGSSSVGIDPVQKDTVLYTVNPDGTHLLKLRAETHECPYWSPDSKRITTTDAVMNGDGNGFHTLAIPNGPVGVGCGVWSPDGKRIVAEGWNETDASQTGLYSLRSTDGGDARQLTTSPFGHDVPIGFAPDGSSIAFTRDGRGRIGGDALPCRPRWLPRATHRQPPHRAAPIGLPMGDPSSSRARVNCSAWTWRLAGPRLSCHHRKPDRQSSGIRSGHRMARGSCSA